MLMKTAIAMNDCRCHAAGNFVHELLDIELLLRNARMLCPEFKVTMCTVVSTPNSNAI